MNVSVIEPLDMVEAECPICQALTTLDGSKEITGADMVCINCRYGETGYENEKVFQCCECAIYFVAWEAEQIICGGCFADKAERE